MEHPDSTARLDKSFITYIDKDNILRIYFVFHVCVHLMISANIFEFLPTI